MKIWITALCTSLSLLSGTASLASANPVVYQQARTGTDADTSQFDTDANGDFSKVYDDFSLATTTVVTDVRWTGKYFTGSRTTGVDSFLIQFWSGASTPDALLYSATIVNANETLVLPDIYDYSVELGQGFVAQAGTQYWISIQATMFFPPQWGWVDGSGGDLVSYQDFFGVRTQLPFDKAFTLAGKPADLPEPASLLLVGLALAGAGLARRAKAER